MPHHLDWLTARPIAHRGYHNAEKNIYENTLSACRQAIAHGFNIEVDIHPAKDGTPVIFHDLTLERMTGQKQELRNLSASQLANISIPGTTDHIATLEELLELTNGKTGLVLELKGLAGADEGFVKAVAKTLDDYHGPFAIMSFYHWLLADAHQYAPHLPLGLTALGEEDNYKMHLMAARQYEVDFVSYKWKHLPCRFVTEFKAGNKPVICWTVKSAAHMQKAMNLCDQITFEGFNPDNVDFSNPSAIIQPS